jgi:RNA polymerase sigma factor for flagellar operon FliA
MARDLVRRLPPSVDVDDLIAAGNLGVATALARFTGDPKEIEGYAMVHARGAMLDELRRVDTMSRAGRRKARKAREVMRALRTHLGRAPADAEVAEAMAIEVGDLRDLLCQMGYTTVEAGTTDVAGRNGGVVVADEFSPMEDRLDEQRARIFVAAEIAKLPPRHATVITLSFSEGKTLEVIARALGVSVARAGQIREVALAKLRQAYVANDIGVRTHVA